MRRNARYEKREAEETNSTEAEFGDKTDQQEVR
jgi:hypothetical protein